MTNRIPQVLALLVTATVLGGPAWAQNPAPSAPTQAARPERGGPAQVESRIAGLRSRFEDHAGAATTMGRLCRRDAGERGAHGGAAA